MHRIINHTKRHLLNKNKFLLAGVILSVVSLPVLVLVVQLNNKNQSKLAHAAGSIVSFEAESGVLAAPATIINDPLASAGNAVDLGAATTTACTGVQVSPGQDIQSLINANPAGTTFCLAPGVHRVSAGLVPKNNQQFIGAYGAIIDGAKVVTGWTVNGSDWVATGYLPSFPFVSESCDPAFPLCGQAQDIFRDGTWLSPVSSRAALAPGKAYLDYAANKIYVRDDPTGHTIEQSYSPNLFTGSGTGVQIKNLILQHAASIANYGAIDPLSGGTGWVLDHNESRWNHGYGIGPAQVAFGETVNMTVTANNVHHNGQDGTGGDGVGNVVQGNEVHHNSYAGYDVLWDGGNKFGHARNLVVTGNYYHDERGVGIWCDINCEDVTIANNYVARTQRGIMYEISCRASIHDNIVVDSVDNSPNGWGGIGILISNSEGAEVYNNKIYNSTRGIWAVSIERPEARDCTGGAEHVTKNLKVHNNEMDLNGPDAPFGAKVGLWTDQGRTDLYTTLNNSFTANTYHDTASGYDWNWGMTSPPYTEVINFATWQSRGQDTSSLVINDDPTPPSPPSLVVGPQSSGSGSTDYVTVNVPSDGTYRVWSRINAPDQTNNSYTLKIDNNPEITVGDTTIPTNQWTWVDYRNGNTSNKIDVALTSGTHTITLKGRESHVKIDRIILTSDTTCLPTGNGDNCTTPSGSQIVIHAAGSSADGIYPIMNLKIDDVIVATWNAVQGDPSNRVFQTFTYNHPTTVNLNQIKVEFTNDGNNATEDRNLTVDKMTLDGVDYQTEASSTLSTGSWRSSDGCDPGFKQDEVLACAGYFWYGQTVATPTPTVAQQPTNTPTPTVTPTRTPTPTPVLDTIKPTVSITSPANNSIVARKVNINVQATASDNVGVTKVEFRRNGTLVCSDTTAPYSCSMTTDNGKNVTVTYEARAYDAAGNTAISSVTVKTQ